MIESSTRLAAQTPGWAPFREPRSERNRLLRSLPAQVQDALRPRLRTVQLAAQQVLSEAGSRTSYVYFPQNALTSLVSPMRGTPIEVALVGNEGLVGVPVVAGAPSMPMHVIVQVAGEAKQIEADEFVSLMRQHAPLRDTSLKYLLALTNQIGQESVCNQLHTLVQRCARWLLLANDRVGGADLRITQATLASLLGVRRPSVTIAASALQRAGTIRYSRGRIRIVDRAALEGAACECYRMITRAYDELLPEAATAPAPSPSVGVGAGAPAAMAASSTPGAQQQPPGSRIGMR